MSKENKLPEIMKVDAGWEDDCSGKKNFDGSIVSISTRYWPRGGGFGFITNNIDGKVEISHNVDNQIKPSAKSSVTIYWKSDESTDTPYDPGYYDITSKEFEAETEEEVKQAVELWANEQHKIITDAIINLYKHKTK